MSLRDINPENTLLTLATDVELSAADVASLAARMRSTYGIIG